MQQLLKQQTLAQQLVEAKEKIIAKSKASMHDEAPDLSPPPMSPQPPANSASAMKVRPDNDAEVQSLRQKVTELTTELAKKEVLLKQASSVPSGGGEEMHRKIEELTALVSMREKDLLAMRKKEQTLFESIQVCFFSSHPFCTHKCSKYPGKGLANREPKERRTRGSKTTKTSGRANCRAIHEGAYYTQSNGG